MSKDYGYLQHGSGTQGPFRTENVQIKNEYADIVYLGERITVQIEGL